MTKLQKILSGLILLLMINCQEYLVAPQMTENDRRQYTSLTCENKNGTDGRVRDSKTRLLYYVYNAGFDFVKNECAKKYKEYVSSQLFHVSINEINGKFMYEHGFDCIRHYRTGIISLNLIAVNLRTNDEEFVVSILNKNASHIEVVKPSPEIAITSNGPRLDMFYSQNFTVIHQTTMRCAGVLNITRKMGGNRITTPVVDWVTSNVYFISDSGIMVCDQNFVFCAALPTTPKTRVTRTLFLAISPERRLLFSVVEQKSNAVKYQLLVHSLDNGSKPLSVHQYSRNPKWITVDSAMERLYWFDSADNNELSLYSSDFKGEDLKKILPGKWMLTNLPFAVLNNTMYWLTVNQLFIIKCSIHNCINSTSIFQKVTFKGRSLEKAELGSLIIDYRSSNLFNHTDLCNFSSCSHLCLPESETVYRCYCQHLQEPISLSDKNNGFCEDHTLLAVYKNTLYIIGLPDDDFSTPKIREHKINVSSIAAVSYDSINGKVILTEAGQQKIYLWLPLTKKLELILDEGPGTINSLVFDHYANNLYWINPRLRIIKAMNLGNRMKVNILKGNSSYIPIQFVLIPSTGYMSVLFLRDNSSITIEYGMSMDGICNTRQVLLHQEDIKYNVEDLSLYYLKKQQTICLLNRQANTIRYFPTDGTPVLKPSIKEEVTSKIMIESLAFLKNSIVWSEEDLVIQKAQVSLEDLLISRPRVPRISLFHHSATDLDTGKNGVFRLFGIERQIEIPDDRYATTCLQDNGDCEEVEMCLVSPGYLQVTCLRPEGEELMSNISCARMKQLQSTRFETGSIISNQKNSTKPIDYQSTTNIILDTIHCFMLIVTFLILTSFMGYMLLGIICSVKKRIGRSSQRNDLTSVPYWNAESQFPVSYPCDDEYCEDTPPLPLTSFKG